MTLFYTYLYRDPKDNKPIYVGKGKNNRALKHFKASSRLGNLLRKRTDEGYIISPIVNYEKDEKTALEMEKFWINHFGRADLGLGTLFNLTNGGEGFTGYMRKGPAHNKGKKGKTAWNKGLKGKLKHTPEAIEKISQASKTRKFSEESLAKRVASCAATKSAKGTQVITEETREKLCLSQMARRAREKGLKDGQNS